MKVSSCFFALILSLSVGVSVAPANAQAGSAEADGSRKLVNKITPMYPTIARSMNLSGSVKLEVVVASSGSVKSIQVLGGNPLFSQSAESAVHNWKWEKSDHDTTEHVEVRFAP